MPYLLFGEMAWNVHGFAGSDKRRHDRGDGGTMIRGVPGGGADSRLKQSVDEDSDETRVVVSEPLGDLAGAWNEVPESHVGIVQPGADELRPFTPRP